MRRRAAGAAFALMFGGALLTAACSLTSLDGFSDGRSAGSTDAGGATSDATDESTPLLFDAGDAGPFCASQNPRPTFCSDFDQPLPGPWASVSEVRGGTVKIDQGSLVSDVPTAGSGASAACVSRPFSGPYTKIRIEFDIRIDQLGDEPYDFITLDKDTQHEIGLQILRTGFVQIDEDLPVPDSGGAETQRLTLTDVRFVDDANGSPWKHARIDFSISTAQATLDIDIGGVKKTGYVLNTPVAVATTFTLQLGDCTISEDVKPWKVRFDNFVLDAL